MSLYNVLYLPLFWVVYQFKMIFPYWIGGLLVGSLASVYLRRRIGLLAERLGGSRCHLGAVLVATLLGAASPVCMYGTVPLIASLGRRGVPQHLLFGFMVSSILINPNLFIFSFTLGAPLALVRLAAAVGAGFSAALLARRFVREGSLFDLRGLEDGRSCRAASPRIRDLLRDIHRAVIKTAPYFLAGIVLAALYECYVPKDLVSRAFGPQNGFGILTAASLGIPIYVCGGGTIPLLKVWLGSGMSWGAAAAFMITGPATKLTNLGAVKIILGSRNFVRYILFAISFALLAGFLVDLAHGALGG